MKYCTNFCLILILIFVFPTYSDGENFLGVPVVSPSKVTKRTGARLELKTKLSHNEAVKYYQEALKGLSDIKFREWKLCTYIEDHGNRPWHSISIFKDNGEGGVKVVIVKDNWTWIFGTLILRFIGVFVVLMIIYMCLSISGRIMPWILKKA